MLLAWCGDMQHHHAIKEWAAVVRRKSLCICASATQAQMTTCARTVFSPYNKHVRFPFVQHLNVLNAYMCIKYTQQIRSLKAFCCHLSNNIFAINFARVEARANIYIRPSSYSIRASWQPIPHKRPTTPPHHWTGNAHIYGRPRAIRDEERRENIMRDCVNIFLITLFKHGHSLKVIICIRSRGLVCMFVRTVIKRTAYLCRAAVRINNKRS